MPDHEHFMRRAIELSRTTMRAGEGGPFAAIVVRDGNVIGEGWNRVTSHNDPTAHAEIVAIRHACETVGAFSLEGATLYTTCEPCPMCLAAVYWARMDELYFANTAEDAADAGFDDLYIYGQMSLGPKERDVRATSLLRDEALEVFREWRSKADRIDY